MSQGIITLETLSCPSCMQKIEGAVKSLNGVDQDSIKVLFNSSKVKVQFDENVLAIEDIEKAIQDMGYPVVKSKVKVA
ncbi:cation transporter [Aerococcaceae bacterium DSM 111021]|nr:cation transporter [Aerococcaceae bacterium DSM 111021]